MGSHSVQLYCDKLSSSTATVTRAICKQDAVSWLRGAVWQNFSFQLLSRNALTYCAHMYNVMPQKSCFVTVRHFTSQTVSHSQWYKLKLTFLHRVCKRWIVVWLPVQWWEWGNGHGADHDMGCRDCQRYVTIIIPLIILVYNTLTVVPVNNSVFVLMKNCSTKSLRENSQRFTQ